VCRDLLSTCACVVTSLHVRVFDLLSTCACLLRTASFDTTGSRLERRTTYVLASRPPLKEHRYQTIFPPLLVPHTSPAICCRMRLTLPRHHGAPPSPTCAWCRSLLVGRNYRSDLSVRWRGDPDGKQRPNLDQHPPKGWYQQQSSWLPQTEESGDKQQRIHRQPDPSRPHARQQRWQERPPLATATGPAGAVGVAGVARLEVAGRLDTASSGLLVWTESGAVSKRITESGLEKEYIVRVAPAAASGSGGSGGGKWHRVDMVAGDGRAKVGHSRTVAQLPLSGCPTLPPNRSHVQHTTLRCRRLSNSGGVFRTR
jgi:hypothetical protein